VRAVDKAGNVGPASNQASATIAGDATAPTVALTAPAAGNVSGGQTMTATATDNLAVDSVQFRIDGLDSGGPDTAAPYTRPWDTTTVTDGQHTITAVARDASGNTTTSAPRTVFVHNTSLVAAYGFEETSGTSALDFINSFNGTISGATRDPAGRFGRALSFDGTNDWVTIADRAELDLMTAGTLEAWVKPATIADWRSVVLKERTGSLPYSLYASTDTGFPSAHIQGSASTDVFDNAGLGLSSWSHLAMTWDVTGLRLYVDGAEVATQTVTLPLVASSGAVRIGGTSLGARFFSGLIDEVRIFNTARTPAQIAGDMTTPVRP
jgi:hypothetical protein